MGCPVCKKLMQWLPADTKVNVVRAFEDGDFVLCMRNTTSAEPISRL